MSRTSRFSRPRRRRSPRWPSCPTSSALRSRRAHLEGSSYEEIAAPAGAARRASFVSASAAGCARFRPGWRKDPPVADTPFDRLGRELEAAAVRQVAAAPDAAGSPTESAPERPPRRRRRSLGLFGAVIAVPVLAATAWAASALISTGSPVAYRDGAPVSGVGVAAPVAGSVKLLTTSVPDPDGGLAVGAAQLPHDARPGLPAGRTGVRGQARRARSRRLVQERRPLPRAASRRGRQSGRVLPARRRGQRLPHVSLQRVSPPAANRAGWRPASGR